MMYRHHALSEREKAYRRRVLGLKKPHSLDLPAPAIKKVREYLAPVKLGFEPRGFGRKVKGISAAKFAVITAKRAAIGKGVHLV